MSKPGKLTILGAGIIGVCCALEAVEAGFEVTVLDRLAPGEATSHGIAGVISPWSVVPQAMPGIWKNVPKWFFDPRGPVKIRWQDLPRILPWVRSFFGHATQAEATRISDAMAWLMQDNIRLFESHLKDTPGAHLIKESHLLTLYRDKSRPNFKDLASILRQRHGADLEVLEGPEIQAFEPDISTEYRFAVALKNQARTTDPGRVCKLLAQKAERLGVTFKHCNIHAIKPCEDGSFELHHQDGVHPTPRLAICAGAWSLKLLEPLGIKVPLIGERGYHVVFKDPGVRLNNSISDASAKVILSQMDAGIRIAGTAEFADPDAPPNYARARALVPLAKRILPQLETSQQTEWMGVRPSFPDNLPVIDRLGDFRNLYGAFGHSHYGFGMAPQTARLMQQLLLRTPINKDVSSVRSDRF